VARLAVSSTRFTESCPWSAVADPPRYLAVINLANQRPVAAVMRVLDAMLIRQPCALYPLIDESISTMPGRWNVDLGGLIHVCGLCCM
jgi:hypothetical protein